MKCTNCGKENLDSASFCKHCGHKLSVNSVQPSPKPKAKSKRAALSSVGGVLIFLAVVGISRYLGEKGASTITNTPSKQEIVSATVQQLKSENTLPKELDEVTIWTDVVEQPNAIRYQYTLHDVDESQISNESLKNIIAPELCKSSDVTSGILDQDINMEYSYTVRESNHNYFFVVTKSDCQ